VVPESWAASHGVEVNHRLVKAWVAVGGDGGGGFVWISSSQKKMTMERKHHFQ